MRLKLQSNLPLLPLRAWFPLPEFKSLNLSTINDLKHHLCAHLPLLNSAHVIAQDIVLVLDDFELLNETDVGVLRDGDLVCINVDSSRSSTKRKASKEEQNATRKKLKKPSTQHASSSRSKSLKRKRGGDTSSSSSSSSSASSDSDEDSSNSSSNSSSDSSSDSSNSDSSAASSAPTHVRSNIPNRSKASISSRVPLRINKSNTTTTSTIRSLVPPGLGKTSTHSRNLRRRRKKAINKRGSTTPAPSKIVSSTNGVLLDSTELHSNSPHEPEGQEHGGEASLTMLSLVSRNKNKRKNFQTSFGDSLPKKIIFGPVDGSASSLSSSNSSSSGSSSAPPIPVPSEPALISTPATLRTQTHVLADGLRTPSTPASRPRLIPPSERQELGTLPARMFVSGVDVEEGGTRKKKKQNVKQKWTELEEKDGQELEAEQGWLDPQSFYADPDLQAMNPTPQNNYHPTNVNGTVLDPSYATVERTWSSYRKIEGWEMLSVGCVVGWWALAINPSTYSPENLLILARVVSISRPDDQVVVQSIPRPGASMISFGGVVADAEAMEGAGEEEYSWEDIVDREWRLVRN